MKKYINSWTLIGLISPYPKLSYYIRLHSQILWHSFIYTYLLGWEEFLDKLFSPNYSPLRGWSELCNKYLFLEGFYSLSDMEESSRTCVLSLSSMVWIISCSISVPNLPSFSLWNCAMRNYHTWHLKCGIFTDFYNILMLNKDDLEHLNSPITS